MHNIKFGMLALAAGFLFQGVAPQSAQAAPLSNAARSIDRSADAGIVQVRHGGHHFGHGPRFHGPRFHGPRFHGPRFHGSRFYGHRGHFRHRHWGPRFWGPRYWGGPSIYLYSGHRGCYWLKRRAINTGSSYWWRRYNACRFGW